MQKTILTIAMAMLCLNFSLKAQEPTKQKLLKIPLIKGRILDEKGESLPGASVKVKNTKVAVVTSNDGSFTLNNLSSGSVIEVSFIGYEPKELSIKEGDESIIVFLKPTQQQLNEVAISTGYQVLPKERSTGSFDQIDNELFNRSTGTGVLDRLDGVASSTIFDRRDPRLTGKAFIAVRGLSTLNTLPGPLIILDNFPYEGKMENLNPNDVENITILKDAAAASIWGAKAGNGVIVITTKKGKKEQALKLTINSNLSLINKPDLYYYNQISSSDYIDVEKYLFDQGFYDAQIKATVRPPLLTPVVKVLAKLRANEISETAAGQMIGAYRSEDVRRDYTNYVYREGTQQQYALNLSGGGKEVAYYFSAGYDKNLNNLSVSANDRLNLRSSATFYPLKGLEIETGLLYTFSNSATNTTESPIGFNTMLFGSKSLYPYARLADDAGNPLAIERGFRKEYMDKLLPGKLLDWSYKPLEDMKMNSFTSKAKDLLVNLGLKYKLTPVLSAELRYMYEHTGTENLNWQGANSYLTRFTINSYTQKDGSRPIPLGDIINPQNQVFTATGLRGQVNLNKVWKGVHELSAIGGAEIREDKTTFRYYKIFGYNAEFLNVSDIDFTGQYANVFGYGTAKIPNSSGIEILNNRYVSLYANAAYSYDSRYIFSASVRKDAANLFGLKSNKKGVPLWSAGLAWNINKESFYNLEWLPYLKMRLTYGYSGNISGAPSAKAIIAYQGDNYVTGLPFGTNSNAPNPSLRWEKTAMLNLGLDFANRNNRISGSLEYYDKRSSDLYSYSSLDQTTGFAGLLINSANMNGRGIDLSLNTKNLTAGRFSWDTRFLFNYNQNRVAKYLFEESNISNYINSGLAPNPIQGKHAYALFSYKFAGLDPATGDPMGYVNGVASKDYATIRSPKSINDLEYHGSAIPVYFGTLINTFSYRNFSVSFNIGYQFGYYFRREALNYASLFNAGKGAGDFSKRWQKPGDEKITNVPSMIYPLNRSREDFYAASSALVEKGDHIRLNDITAGYLLNNKGKYFKQIRLYANLSNVGVLWSANKVGIDPLLLATQSTLIRPSLTKAFGFTASF
ncbi:SusC/RagA family TonB-linked outer membrane protein [Pedobacter caeni]|uniref:TonB-linked outer membrane protein, SusC/RagA family n=1 Tax=Pedobacter caeni TaxID=288992 RepID=A0A1M5JPG6_9SPHI|nr:SusC/RagA family TonB-linked outer membrane protein [Pedobacter caeni]SHG42305.1 TonB-linked outer membrane protein, SusC/RagA family [Pedobacter caeni]